MFSKKYYFKNRLLKTTAHPWCGGHFTSINACKVWGVRVEVQVSRREFHIHIHLDWDRVEILSCIQKDWDHMQLHHAITPFRLQFFFLYILLLFNFNFLLLFNIFFLFNGWDWKLFFFNFQSQPFIVIAPNLNLTS